MKTITVQFLDTVNTYGNRDKTYDYLVEDDAVVSAGDHAVVHNGSDLRLTKVLSVSGNVSLKATKTVVSIITTDDMTKYNDANKAIGERKKLFARLDQILAAESELNKYKILAASNTEAAEILAKLNIK